MFKKIVSITISLIFLITFTSANIHSLDKKVYSIKNTAQYENPITNELEDLKMKEDDKQYKSKKLIGDTMVRAVLGEYAILDNTSKTKTLTIKISGASSEKSKDIKVKDIKIFVKNLKDDKYKEVKYTVVKEDKKKKTKDIKFEVPQDEAYIKISAKVVPMGRDIIFFAQMSTKDAKEGAKDFNSQKMKEI